MRWFVYYRPFVLARRLTVLHLTVTICIVTTVTTETDVLEAENHFESLARGTECLSQ